MNKEFKAIVIKMLNELRKTKNKENKKVNKETENIIKNQAENLEMNIQN